MTLPQTHKGHTIVARKSNRTNTWWLETANPAGVFIKRYRPPMQIIYMATNGNLAYDDDVAEVRKRIDKHLQKTEVKHEDQTV